MTMWDQVTNQQRDAFVANIVGGFTVHGVPPHLRPGLVRYFGDGILPGSFLQAVLVNDLRQAIQRADPESLDGLPALVQCLVATAPAIAWGSRQAVRAWSTTGDWLEI
jgi:hypothetical protein